MSYSAYMSFEHINAERDTKFIRTTMKNKHLVCDLDTAYKVMKKDKNLKYVIWPSTRISGTFGVLYRKKNSSNIETPLRIIPDTTITLEARCNFYMNDI
jgi:hypothetical protein